MSNPGIRSSTYKITTSIERSDLYTPVVKIPAIQNHWLVKNDKELTKFQFIFKEKTGRIIPKLANKIFLIYTITCLSDTSNLSIGAIQE